MQGLPQDAATWRQDIAAMRAAQPTEQQPRRMTIAEFARANRKEVKDAAD